MSSFRRKCPKAVPLFAGGIMLAGTLLVIRGQLRAALDMDFTPDDSLFWDEGLGSQRALFP